MNEKALIRFRNFFLAKISILLSKSLRLLCTFYGVLPSIVDPRNFGMDRDPRIHTLMYGSGFDFGSCSFRQWLSRYRQNISFLAYYNLKENFHFSSKIKSDKEVTKQ